MENNFLYYDFNPSGGHHGVVKFKKGFGTEFKSSNLYNKQSKVLHRLSSIYNKIGF